MADDKDYYKNQFEDCAKELEAIKEHFIELNKRINSHAKLFCEWQDGGQFSKKLIESFRQQINQWFRERIRVYEQMAELYTKLEQLEETINEYPYLASLYFALPSRLY